MYRHNFDSDGWGGWVPTFVPLLFPLERMEFEDFFDWYLENRAGTISSIFNAYHPKGTLLCRTTHLHEDLRFHMANLRITVSKEKWDQLAKIGVVETYPILQKKNQYLHKITPTKLRNFLNAEIDMLTASMESPENGTFRSSI